MNPWNIAALTGVVTIGGKIAGNKTLEKATYMHLLAGAFFYLLIISLFDAANAELASAFAMLVFVSALLANAIPIVNGLGLSK